jgi:ferritin
MLLNQNIVSAINQQIGNEFGASLQYVTIASYFATERYLELSGFFYRQAAEERDHAMRFVKFVVDCGARVEIPAIAAPKAQFSSIEDALQLSLHWEQEVTRQITALVDLANKENDHITNNFLAWFLAEQLEEIRTMDTLLKVAQRAGNNGLLVEDYIARNRSKLGEGAEDSHEQT